MSFFCVRATRPAASWPRRCSIVSDRGGFRRSARAAIPKVRCIPLALRLLQERGIPTDGLRSKGWEEFAVADTPAMDLIVTVCDNAAGEVCPVWPGQPTIAHWGVQDPAAVEGTETERMRAFERAAKALETRIRLLTALHLDQSDRSNLKERLDRIGHSGTEEDQ
jgi:arsenate reductase (thioredoxin)